MTLRPGVGHGVPLLIVEIPLSGNALENKAADGNARSTYRYAACVPNTFIQCVLHPVNVVVLSSSFDFYRRGVSIQDRFQDTESIIDGADQIVRNVY